MTPAEEEVRAADLRARSAGTKRSRSVWASRLTATWWLVPITGARGRRSNCWLVLQALSSKVKDFTFSIQNLKGAGLSVVVISMSCPKKCNNLASFFVLFQQTFIALEIKPKLVSVRKQ